MTHVAATPVVAIVPMFLLLLLIVGFVFLLIKAPKVAAGIIGAFVAVVVVLFYVRGSMRVSQMGQATLSAPDSAVVQYDAMDKNVAHVPNSPANSPIWSEAIEREFEADLYPSKTAAARALGMRMAEPIRRIAPNEPSQIILFEQDGDRDIATAFKRGLELKSPGLGERCSIEAASRSVTDGEVGVTFVFQVKPTDNPIRDWPVMLGRMRVRNGEIQATAAAPTGRRTMAAQFISKPWVEDFAAFASERPREQYVVARCMETCTSANEARRQALEDARQQLDRMVGARQTTPGRPPVTITTRDVQEGGFINDTFVQSFDGSAGKIWRQAMLIDVSAPKLAWLTNRTTHAAQSQRLNWARQIGSAVGVLVLILVTYFFLNMATRGYYEWSLRIAGLVLAIIAIVVFLA